MNAQGRKPTRKEKHDAALTSAEKKIAAKEARTGKSGGSFLGSRIRRAISGGT